MDNKNDESKQDGKGENVDKRNAEQLAILEQNYNRAISGQAKDQEKGDERDVYEIFVACNKTENELYANAKHINNEQLKQKGKEIIPLTAQEKKDYDSYLRKDEILRQLDPTVASLVNAMIIESKNYLKNPSGFYDQEAHLESKDHSLVTEERSSVSSLTPTPIIAVDADIQKAFEACCPTKDEIGANAKNALKGKLKPEESEKILLTEQDLANLASYQRKKTHLQSLKPVVRDKVTEMLLEVRKRLNNSKEYDLSALSQVPVQKRKAESTPDQDKNITKKNKPAQLKMG